MLQVNHTNKVFPGHPQTYIELFLNLYTNIGIKKIKHNNIIILAKGNGGEEDLYLKTIAMKFFGKEKKDDEHIIIISTNKDLKKNIICSPNQEIEFNAIYGTLKTTTKILNKINFGENKYINQDNLFVNDIDLSGLVPFLRLFLTKEYFCPIQISNEYNPENITTIITSIKNLFPKSIIIILVDDINEKRTVETYNIIEGKFGNGNFFLSEDIVVDGKNLNGFII